MFDSRRFWLAAFPVAVLLFVGAIYLGFRIGGTDDDTLALRATPSAPPRATTPPPYRPPCPTPRLPSPTPRATPAASAPRISPTPGGTPTLTASATPSAPPVPSPSPVSAETEALLEQLAGVEWYGAYIMGQKLGFMRMELRREGAGAARRWLVETQVKMQLSAMGQTYALSQTSRRVYAGPGLRLTAFESSMSQPLGPATACRGELDGAKFRVENTIGGQTTTRRRAPPAETLLDQVAEQLAAARGELKVGDEFKHVYFMAEPEMQGEAELAVRVASREQQVFFGVPTDVYVFRCSMTLQRTKVDMELVVDGQGRALKVTAGAGIVMRLEPEELARRLDYSNDILVASLIRVKGFPGNPKQCDRLTLRLGPLTDPGLRLENERQQYAPVADRPDFYELQLRRDEFDPAQAATLPFPADAALADDLAATETLQADAPEIRELAARIVGDEKNAYRAAAKLNQWVFANLAKEFVPALSNALDTLRSRKGDCGEHAALFVALCRAAGIPAREATGLVYAREVRGFGFHAWGEVCVGGGRWVSMDPSWGETDANASHILLARGGFAEQLRLLPLLGRLKITILAPAPATPAATPAATATAPKATPAAATAAPSGAAEEARRKGAPADG